MIGSAIAPSTWADSTGRRNRSSGQAETYFVDSTSTVTEYGAKL